MKKYITPKMEVIDMGHQTELLSASDNSFWRGRWEEPEEKEGCDTPYWCK